MNIMMNETSANVNDSVTNDIETLDYLRGVKSSTCLLLPMTPSPTPLDFKHPLSEEMTDGAYLNLDDDPNMVKMQADASAGDSSSSGDSNSVVQDPVSAQLINNISMLDYQTLSKNGDLIMGQTEEKLNGNLGVSNRKLPNFVNWNWTIIRKVLLWIVCSCLIACIAAIVAMVVTIPKECNPDLPWHQGKVFYEILPSSSKDSNHVGTENLKGLINKLDYIQDLGASAIRLNYIYKYDEYLKEKNINSLLDIDRSVGELKDFRDLVANLHSRNMSLVLDLPVVSLANLTLLITNFTEAVLISNEKLINNLDPTSAALAFWKKEGVDGFYLKELDSYVDEPNFGRTLQFWKQIIGSDKIFITSEIALEKAKGDSLNVLLSRIDLIDVHLDLKNGIKYLKNHINKITDGILWGKPYYPWVLWNIGDNEKISANNKSLALTALEFILPGSVNIFFGDESSLEGLTTGSIDDFQAIKKVNNITETFLANNENNIGDITSRNNISELVEDSFLEVVKHFTKIRLNTPTIYLRATYKEGVIQKNMKIRQTDENLVVIERWFPRRNTCVFVWNVDNKSITTDLSSMFYGGTVIAGTNSSLVGQVLYFDQVTFPPNSAIILKLEK